MKNIDIQFTDVLTPMFIYKSDTWDIEEVNHAALELYGYTREEMLSLNIGELHPEHKLPEVKEFLNQKNNTHRNSGVWRHLTKNGDTLYVQIYSHRINYQGEECRLVFIQDVTRRRQLEKELESEREIFNLLIEKLPGSVYLLNKNQEMMRWNERMEELTGYSTEEVEEMKALDFIPESEKTKVRDAISKAFNEGYVEIESYLEKKNGEYLPVYYKATRLNVYDQECVLGVGIDISQQKKDQQHISSLKQFYQSIMDQAGSLIWVKDPDQRYIYVNQAFLDFFNVSRDEIIGEHKSTVLSEQNLTAMQETDQEVLESKQPLQAEEVIHKGGEKRVFLTSKFLLDHDIKFGKYICGISTDITERKRAEDELKQSLKERETLLAEIHHRVKNNLAVITGMMHLQAMESEQPEVRKKLESSQMRIHSIALIHELLYQSDTLNDVNLGKHLKQLINQISNTLYSNAEIDINLKLQPVKLNVNQALPCANIANELVTNAYKHAFTDQRSGTITVRLYEEDEQIYLEVSDNGKGLPDDIDIESSESLGFDLVNNLVKQLEGELDHKRKDGNHFVLRFEKANLKGSVSGLIEEHIYGSNGN